ncbi:Ulp1-like peptidase [Cucumis melo var. makuwa]|uniref:Ulp1-like peptidase n=1 Tax=Cucumis melo var. makuwa TaxID=1194695 RepID=A0A5A7V0Z2_CUCMM|nr:Ulp1-like peptidase [Cucumis melo var. makuwa]TYK15384.1 Ulp1-like peptidase [Cucumis melo var. makuwa]
MKNRTTDKCSFEIVYSKASRLTFDLTNLPTKVELQDEAQDIVKCIQKLHNEVQDHLIQNTTSYKEGKEKTREVRFQVGDLVMAHLRKKRREFNIITGLWGSKEDYIQLVGNSRLLEKFFKDKKCIYVSDLEDIFLEYEGDDDDIVKLALVYFIEISLLGKDRRTKVDIGFFKIADDWNTFNNYNWGRIVFGRTLSALKRSLDKQYAKGKKKSTQTKKYIVNGFPHALQFIIKAVIEMTPEEEQLKIALGELFENFRSSTIIQSKNGGSKRVREVVNDEDDFKKRQLTSIKSYIDELKGMISTILKHIGLQRKGDEGDRKVSKGLVDHTLESKEVDNAKTEDVDTGGTPNWLRMPKEDEHIELKKKGDEDVHTVGTPPWLRFNIELEKPIDVLEKKVSIGLEEPIDIVDDEVEIQEILALVHMHFLWHAMLSHNSYLCHSLASCLL